MKRVDLTIVTHSHTAPGAVLLCAAAMQRGMTTYVGLIDDADIAEQINAARHAIYRISPRRVSQYKALLGSLDDSHARDLQAALTAFDKGHSYEVMKRAGVPMPTTATGSLIDLIGTHDHPYILKVTAGNQGKGVYLVESSADEKAILLHHEKDAPFVLQEFVKEATGEDKRLFVVDGQVVASMTRRAAPGTFLANLHQGGSASTYLPTRDEVEIALDATKSLGLLFAGVDLINSKDGPLVLEVNPSPGFKISEITNVDVPAMIIEALVKQKGSQL